MKGVNTQQPIPGLGLTLTLHPSLLLITAYRVTWLSLQAIGGIDRSIAATVYRLQRSNMALISTLLKMNSYNGP